MKWIIFENTKLALEAVAVFGVVLLFWLHPAVKKARRTASLRMIVYGIGFMFALEALAQTTTRHQYDYPQKHEPFPFTRWAMFAGVAGSMESGLVYDWRGITAAGALAPLNPAHLYLTPNAVVLFTKTHALGDQIPADGQPAEPSVIGALDAFAEGLLARYNVLHPAAPIVKVELWKRIIPLQQGTEAPGAFAMPGSKLVHTYTHIRP